MTPPSPLQPAPASLVGRRDVFLKREDLHELGAFKWRGALPAVEAFRSGGASAVVTASTGNHGAATAWAAKRSGLAAIIFAPERASRAKLALIESLGAELRTAGRDLDEAKEEARRFAGARGLPFFEDGAEPVQYAGYAAIAMEILEQMDAPPAAVVVPVGNGALLGGMGALLREGSPGTRVIGVVAKEAPVMALSVEAGRPVPCGRMATFADGLAVRVAIPRAVEVLGRVADRIVQVSERQLARAVGACACAGIRVEGAAAAPLAALPEIPASGGAVVLVVTGRNIDDLLFDRAVSNPDSFPD